MSFKNYQWGGGCSAPLPSLILQKWMQCINQFQAWPSSRANPGDLHVLSNRGFGVSAIFFAWWSGFRIGEIFYSFERKLQELLSLGLEGKILLFVPETLEHPLYTFLMTYVLLFSQKLTTTLKKLHFSYQFCTVPSTFRLPLPKIMGQVCYFITPPYQFWC